MPAPTSRASGSGAAAAAVPSSSLSEAPSSSMAPLSSMTPVRPTAAAPKKPRTSLVAPAFEGRQSAAPPQMPAASPSRGGSSTASQQAHSPMGISAHVLSQASLLAAVGSSQAGRRGDSNAVRRSPAGMVSALGAAPQRLAPPSSPSPRTMASGAGASPSASPRPLMALSALQPVRVVTEPPPPPPPLPRRSASPTRRQMSLSVQAAHLQPATAERASSERQLAAAAAQAAAPPSRHTPLPAAESLLMPAPPATEPPAALPPPAVPPASTPHASPALPASLSSPALPRPPGAPSRHVPRERLSTHLPSLDALLAPLPFPSAQRPYSADEARRIGLRPGGALEIAGPPACGKTALAVAAAVRCRLDSLRRVRARRRARGEKETGEAAGADTWESAAQTAEQVWLVDTEGALIAARLRQAAVSQIAALPDSEIFEAGHAADGDVDMADASSFAAVAESRKALQRAVLSGLHVSRVLSLAALLAHFFLAFPPTLAAPYVGRLPARCALIVLDSLSSPLRFPPGDTSAQRTARTQAFASIASFAARARAANIAVIATNQMASKMFAPGGALSNFRNPDALARLVPQLLAPLVLGADADEMQIVPRDAAEAAWLYAEERGSALGKETNRVTLFRAGPRSQTFAQMVGRPASQPLLPPRAAPLVKPEPGVEAAEPELGWRTWIAFHIDDDGTPFELPDEEPPPAAI